MQRPKQPHSKKRILPVLLAATLLLGGSGPAAKPATQSKPAVKSGQQKAVADFIQKALANSALKDAKLNYERLIVHPAAKAAPGTPPDRPKVDAELQGVALDIQGIPFRGTAYLQNVYSPAARVTMKLKSRPFPLKELQNTNPKLAKMIFPGVLHEGELEWMTLNWQAQLADTRDFPSLMRTASAKTVFKITNAGFKLKDKRVRFSVLHGRASWAHPKWTHELKGNLYQGKLHSKGTTLLDEAAETATLDSTLTLEKVQLSKVDWLKSPDWKFLRGTASGTVRVCGALPLDAKTQDLGDLKGAGTLTANRIFLNVNGTRQQWQEATVTLAESPLLEPKADVVVKDLNVQGIAFQKAKAKVHVQPKIITLTEGKVWPQHGVIDLSGLYETAAKTYRFDLKGSELRAEDFLKKSVSGPAQFQGQFNGSVTPPEKQKEKAKLHFARGLSGNFTLKMNEGSIEKVGEMEKLLTVLNLFSKKEQKKSRLEFNRLGGDFQIRDGLMATENLALDGPQLTLDVKGNTDLPSGKVQAKVKAVPLKLIKDMANVLPGLDKWLKNPKRNQPLETHFKVTGSLEKPKFKLLR